MLTQFEHADAAEPVLEMEKRMDAQRLGAMLVRSDQGRITAVVTKRALVELRLEGVDLTGLSAGEVAREVTPVEARQSPAQAFESLRGQEVGRLPVVDDGVELGIITRGDILLYQAIERSLGDKVADLVVEVSPK